MVWIPSEKTGSSEHETVAGWRINIRHTQKNVSLSMSRAGDEKRGNEDKGGVF